VSLRISDRDSIAQWLASTARKHDYVSPRSRNARESGGTSQGRPTYTVAIKEWTTLAEFIAGLTDPPVNVPGQLAMLLDTTISLRESYSNSTSDFHEDSNAKQESDSSHAFFLGVLKKVRDTLSSRLSKQHASTKKASSTSEVINMFENLDLEEPSEAFEQAFKVTSAPPVNHPIYKAELQNDGEESFFTFYLLLHDLNELRAEVSRSWTAYKIGGHDLVSASIATNVAVDLARSMTEDLKSTFAKQGGAIRMLQVYYAAQCMTSGTPEAHKARLGDDMNFTAYLVADVMFWPVHQLLDAFCSFLKAGPDPPMKRGIYGHYGPHTERAGKSSRDEFKEDKILLFEMLEEFYFYCRTTEPPSSRPPVEDELIRGLRDMFTTKEVTLPLAFVTTLFLDIHHKLRDEVDRARENRGWRAAPCDKLGCM
jgi:hypothetical protein